MKAEEARVDKPGFFSRLFGSAGKPEAKAAPAPVEAKKAPAKSEPETQAVTHSQAKAG
ncbi:hypothetical protein D3C76_1840190 [compost metagenome]